VTVPDQPSGPVHPLFLEGRGAEEDKPMPRAPNLTENYPNVVDQLLENRVSPNGVSGSDAPMPKD